MKPSPPLQETTDNLLSQRSFARPWPAAAIILAGGQSRRMGCDKRFLPCHGRALIQHVVDQVRPHFEAVIIAANDLDSLAFLHLPVVPDAVPGQGPLAGIAAALAASCHDLNFVAACDIPVIDVTLAARLLSEARHCDVVIPRSVDGHPEPLFAVYRRSALPMIEQALAGGIRKITAAVGGCNVRYIPLQAFESPPNLNTEEDYRVFFNGHTGNSPH